MLSLIFFLGTLQTSTLPILPNIQYEKQEVVFSTLSEEITKFDPISSDLSPSTTTVRETIKDFTTLLGVDENRALKIAENESDYFWNASTTKSTARGVFQITKSTWLEKCTDNFDDAWNYKENIKCAVTLMADDQWWRWEQTLDSCSCVRTAHNENSSIPLVDAKWFTSFASTPPKINGVVVLKYGDVHHIAVIKRFTKNGLWVKEGNFKRCEVTEREIDFTDPHILQFWSSS